MKVYIFGEWGPESNTVISIHKTRESAMKAWEKRRLEMLEDAKSHMKSRPEGRKCTPSWLRSILARTRTRCSN